VTEEVRYHRLRPAQAVARRKACPVAYVPLGTLEWHGPHNPLGADGLQAEGLAEVCARTGGGLVFPTLYYGESRVTSLVDSAPASREAIAREMDLPAENFLPERQPFSATDQALAYHRLLVHVLAEMQSLGFRVAVLVAGHYPLVDLARAAAVQWVKLRLPDRTAMLAWACVDYLLVRDRWPQAGDHAGGWETSHILALHPETVDLSALPPRESADELVSTGTRWPPWEASADFGHETLRAAADAVLREVNDRLAHPEDYRAHGGALCEGLWRERPAQDPDTQAP